MPTAVSVVSGFSKVLGSGMLFMACMRRSAAKIDLVSDRLPYFRDLSGDVTSKAAPADSTI